MIFDSCKKLIINRHFLSFTITIDAVIWLNVHETSSYVQFSSEKFPKTNDYSKATAALFTVGMQKNATSALIGTYAIQILTSGIYFCNLKKELMIQISLQK